MTDADDVDTNTDTDSGPGTDPDPGPLEGAVDRLAAALVEGPTAMAFTGAGVSAASGIPTFRGADGVWGEAFDPDDFHRRRFDADPAGFWRDRLALHEHMYGDWAVGGDDGDGERDGGDPPPLPGEAGGPAPNAAHRALAELESLGVLDGVVTQNTDGLHAAAGSSTVELHGSAARVACEACGERSPAGPAFAAARTGSLPPRCDCGGVLKPDVVLFGERLPDGRLSEASSMARRSAVCLAAGSSLTVEPAATVPRLAARVGTLAVVNLDATPLDDLADHVLRRDVTEVLPAISAAVRARLDD
jgi:NAD-dependent deacetylase